MDFTDLKKVKAEKEAKNAKLASKIKWYAILAIFGVLAYYSSLYSVTSIESDGYTTHMLCIGNATIENDFKCFQEFTYTNRF